MKILKQYGFVLVGWLLSGAIAWTTVQIKVENLSKQVETLQSSLAKVVEWKLFQEGKQEGMRIGREWREHQRDSGQPGR